MWRVARLGGVVAACLLGAVAATAAPVVVGMTLPLSGPDAPFGAALRDGAQLAIARANAAGGVAGRPIELALRDDGGDPRRAAANAGQLLQEGAVVFGGALGAASTGAVAEVLSPPGSEPIAALVAPVTSADGLREPLRPGVFHLRAGVAEQASAALLHLDTLGIERYALLVQDDELGRSALERLQFELTRIAIRPVSIERLPAAAKAADLRAAMARVCGAQPQALIVALGAAAAAEALGVSRAQQCARQHLVFSETGAVLAARLPVGRASHPFAGLLVTQVVPHPDQRIHPLVDEFQRERAAYGGSSSHGALEGYLAMRVVVEALRSCDRSLDRRCVLRVLGARSFDLPGMKVQFGPAQRQPRPFVEINLLDATGRLRH
jgi:ABC-type branched-subunit amino acid transport system substrate-binding protein